MKMKLEFLEWLLTFWFCCSESIPRTIRIGIGASTIQKSCSHLEPMVLLVVASWLARSVLLARIGGSGQPRFGTSRAVFHALQYYCYASPNDGASPFGRLWIKGISQERRSIRKSLVVVSSSSSFFVRVASSSMMTILPKVVQKVVEN